MAISLVVLVPRNEECAGINVPIATEDVFRRVWLRGATDLGLKWLPLFQTGVDVTIDDFETVRRELVALRDWTERAPLQLSERNHVVERIETLLQELDRLSRSVDGELKIFIG